MKKRLETVLGLIKPNKIVADIGTDHAYIPCALIEQGIAQKCYACDVIPGPLEAAKKNVQKGNFEQKIEVILSDGLMSVPQDTEVVVIAGMGFITAKEILENGLPLHPKVEQVVIQVNKDVEQLRAWISKNRYTIEKEVVVEENHFYQVISFNFKTREPYSEKENFLGPMLMIERSDTFLKYLDKKSSEYKLILDNLAKDSAKYREIDQRLKWIQEEIGK